MNKIKLFNIKEWPKLLFSYFNFRLLKKSAFNQYDQYLTACKKVSEQIISCGFFSPIIKLALPNFTFLAILRKSTSDIFVYKQVMLDKEYQSVIDTWANNFPNQQPDYILDLGANIGLTSLFLLGSYPNAKSIAVEPETSNYLQLKANIEINNLEQNVRSLQAAIWHKDQSLAIDSTFRDGDKWSMSVREEDASSNTEGISINSLMEKFAIPTIDILKIDIEGAEQHLFENQDTASFLQKTNLICIEVHEEAISKRKVKEILSTFNFSHFESGEHIIGTRQKTLDE